MELVSSFFNYNFKIWVLFALLISISSINVAKCSIPAPGSTANSFEQKYAQQTILANDAIPHGDYRKLSARPVRLIQQLIVGIRKHLSGVFAHSFHFLSKSFLASFQMRQQLCLISQSSYRTGIECARAVTLDDSICEPWPFSYRKGGRFRHHRSLAQSRSPLALRKVRHAMNTQDSSAILTQN
jgi:hypothetical protein